MTANLRVAAAALAVAMNTAQLTPDEFRLGRDLTKPADKLLRAILANPEWSRALHATIVEADPYICARFELRRLTEPTDTGSDKPKRINWKRDVVVDEGDEAP